MILDTSLSFDEHVISVQSKINKTIGLLRKLHNTLPRQELIIINKAFVRPHPGYGNILYDQAYNASFHQKLVKNTVQCLYSNNRRAILGTFKEANKSRIGLRIP